MTMGAPHITDRSDSADGPLVGEGVRISLDHQGVIARWSPAAEKLLGHAAESVVGRSAADLMAGTVSAEVETRADDEFATVLKRSDGASIKCWLLVRPESPADALTNWEVLITPLEPAELARAADIERALLETLFTLSPTGLYLLDPQMRLIRFNAAAEGMQGTSVSEAAGRRPSEVWPGFPAEKVERVMKQVLATGQPIIGTEKTLRPPGDPHHDHVYSTSVFRLEDDHGRILGLADATVDVTDRHLAQERLTVLADASNRIGSTLDVLDTAEALAEVSVPALADSITVDLLQPVLSGEELAPGPVGPDAALRRAASGSRGDGTRKRADRTPAASAVEVLYALEPRLLDPSDREGHRAFRDLSMSAAPGEDVHSLAIVPLVAQDRVLGLATFCRWGDRRPFDADDLNAAAQLGRRTAACLDNARRHLREHNTLIALQHILRPSGLPTQQALDVAHMSVHAGTGGDWVDAIPLSGARVALVAGTLPSRGIQAAAAAGRLSAAVHTLSDLDLEPDELLARLDDVVRRSGTVGGIDECGERPRPGHDQPCDPVDGGTCLYLIYDPVSRRCSASSAGHPWPVIVHPNGVVRTVDCPVGDALCSPGAPFSRTDFELPENSMLVLYTRGLLQQYAQGHDDPGPQRLSALLSGAPGSVQETCAGVIEALVPDQARDDVAVLVARTHALGPEHVVAWDLPSDPATVAEARTLATRQLASWDMDELAFTTELIVSELVTNAIRHAAPPITLRLIRSHVLTCEVSDGSSTSPRLSHARTTDEGGRGLLLVARCSERWGTRYTESGKIIWAEQGTMA
ncbi:SpoIIE family protein phosphatase [Streptomyces cadmiisoli]|uniref:SpoIIE family protein phosphatase n=1 Tax=Streptomyces cadmiisoli TaxID=2184053 RepID=UPI0036662F75